LKKKILGFINMQEKLKLLEIASNPLLKMEWCPVRKIRGG
jgi:hypothetical protein